jgi:hypothetical protein
VFPANAKAFIDNLKDVSVFKFIDTESLIKKMMPGIYEFKESLSSDS